MPLLDAAKKRAMRQSLILFLQKIYIQVTETLMDDTTRKRELEPLQAIKDNYEKLILTTDNLFANADENGIQILNLPDWLLGI